MQGKEIAVYIGGARVAEPHGLSLRSVLFENHETDLPATEEAKIVPNAQ